MSTVTEIAKLSQRQAQLDADPLTIEIVCDALANDSRSLADVAASLGVRARWLRRWLSATPDRMQAYELALAMQIDDAVAITHADLMHASDDESGKLAERKLKGSLALAQHWAPDRYSTKIDHKHSGGVTVQLMELSRPGLILDGCVTGGGQAAVGDAS
jgi:hypothetical protein